MSDNLDGTTAPTGGGDQTRGADVRRRTILAGAAWTIPAIAVATAAPAAASSLPELELEFTQPAYDGEGCGTISDVTVRATRADGTPAAGESVTVTLADGYAFADGSTSYTGTMGADGTLTLPDITVPTDGGSTTFTAACGAVTATAPATGTPAADGVFHREGHPYPPLPAGTRVADITDTLGNNRATYVLSEDGRLYVSIDGGDWTLVAEGVDDYSANNNNQGGAYVIDDTVYFMNGRAYPALPAGMRVADVQDSFNSINGVRRTFVVAEDGSLYQSVDGGAWTLVAENVDKFEANKNNNNGVYVVGNELYGVDGSAFPSLPDGAQIADVEDTFSTTTRDRMTYVLAQDGRLYASTNRGPWRLVSENVTDFAANNNNPGGVYVVGNTVNRMGGGGGGFPALPTGVQIADVSDTHNGNTRQTYVLSDDGRLYVSTDNGPWVLKGENVSDYDANNNTGAGVFVRDACVA